MSALNGQLIMTLRDAAGVVRIEATWFWNTGTGALINGTFVTSTGSKNGALIVDNRTGKAQAVVIADAAGAISRTVNVPSSGFVGTAAQLAALTPSLTQASQLNGLTFQLA